MDRFLNDSRGRAALGLMTCYVLFQSCVPLFVTFGGAENSPFLFTTAWRVGAIAGYALVLALFFRDLLLSGEARKAVARRAFSFTSVACAANFFWTVPYAWSTQHIDVAVSTALFEAWPLFFVLLAERTFRSEGRYQKTTLKSALFFGLAFLGVAFVIASQAGGFGVFFSGDADGANMAKGVSLALLSTCLAALSAFSFKWAFNLVSDLRKLPDAQAESRSRLELFSVAVGTLIFSLTMTPFIALAGFARNEPISSSALIWGVLGGVAIQTVGSLAWRMANVISHSLEINAMNYLIPIVALVWLFAFKQVGDVSAAHLVVGLILIIAANAGALSVSRRKRTEASDA